MVILMEQSVGKRGRPGNEEMVAAPNLELEGSNVGSVQPCSSTKRPDANVWLLTGDVDGWAIVRRHAGGVDATLTAS